jgi:sarcosine oxidase
VTRRFDAVVVGVGGMGSATAYQLAKRGKRVLGLERFDVPNDMGSSHGITRVIRLAYSEHPSYVPLLRRAYELWEELQAQAGEQLLYLTGCVDASSPGGTIFADARRAADEHHLEYEVLSATDLRRRFPGFAFPDDTQALLQPRAGFLLPERCIVAQVEAAQGEGAEIHAREPVIGWEAIGDGVRVRTAHDSYEADRLVITAGAWAGYLVDRLAGLVTAERQVLGWFQPLQPDLFSWQRCPVWQFDADEGRYYGMPIFGIPGFKIGRYHHLEERVDPDRVDREPNAADEAILRSFVERYFPQAAGPTMSMKACLFENSPDEHFIIGVHPDHPQVSFAAGFSGHGFKFCPVVGEIMADLVERGSTRHDISLFDIARFSGG